MSKDDLQGLDAYWKALHNSPDVIKSRKEIAQNAIKNTTNPERYSVVESVDKDGFIIVSIVDKNPDAIFHESQTGELAKIWGSA